MSDAIAEAQRRIYRQAVLEHGDTPRGTAQNNRETQHLRFERLFRNLLPLPPGTSVHDVGCGLGDLHEYLVSRGVSHAYGGSEIVPEMVAVARTRCPGGNILERDFRDAPADEMHDVVVLSGAFNLPGPVAPAAWREFVEGMIGAMYERARVAIAFNVLSTHRTRTDPAAFYFDPEEVARDCRRRFSRFVVVDQGYPLYEATLTVFRPEAVRASHPGEAFDRYFA